MLQKMMMVVGLASCVAMAQPTIPGEATEEAPKGAETTSEQVSEQASEQSLEAKAEAAKAEEEAKRLDEMRREIDRLSTEYQLMMQRQKNAQLEMELRRQELSAAASLEAAEQNAELASSRAQVERLKAEQGLRGARADAELARLQEEARLMQVRNQLLNEELKQERLELDRLRGRYGEEVARYDAELALVEARRKASDKATGSFERRSQPFRDGVLHISDRRIALNGVIAGGTADYVCERIHFYNNQSKSDPIFIVIDDCPGGSVMQGYRIVKAIEASPAPVHVVVKSFAASMAAVITTLAPHSYAYPNAIILHHQMSSGMRGNLTQQAESLENSMEWARRLAVPVADKMGISYEEMVDLMYENNSNGDWEEFADVAQDLQWVQHLVHEIREDGIRERPTSSRSSLGFFFQFEEQVDPRGERFIQLPRLNPYDHWFLHNPDGYFRR